MPRQNTSRLPLLLCLSSIAISLEYSQICAIADEKNAPAATSSLLGETPFVPHPVALDQPIICEATDYLLGAFLSKFDQSAPDKMKYLRLMEVNREKRAHFWKITVKGKNADVIEWGGTIPENNPETYKFTVENSGPDFLVLRLSDAKPEQTSMLCIDAKLGTFISMGFLTPGVVHDDQAASAFLGTCQNP